MRRVCEAALSAADDSSQSGVTIEERVYFLLARKSPKIPLTTYALDELFSMIRRKSCSSFACNSSTQDDSNKWTTTETITSFPSSSNQEANSTPKKIKRKKKKIPPLT
ncbi:uncharacterized protein LOC120353681 [Nilaparvata lugens]|uniref:uncharacterized protein LOC120353681 n=1 Tax=Nilaparvata lugens TaxID=108931 RepID=UPI00193CBDD5|nr:uncharacterized protein LOC120353681 [Nilaparvata lugens]